VNGFWIGKEFLGGIKTPQTNQYERKGFLTKFCENWALWGFFFGHIHTVKKIGPQNRGVGNFNPALEAQTGFQGKPSKARWKTPTGTGGTSAPRYSKLYKRAWKMLL